MNRKIYKKSARKFGVPVEKVKQDLQEVVNSAYKVPTVDEFLDHVASKISNEVREEERFALETVHLSNLVDSSLQILIDNLWESVGCKEQTVNNMTI